MRWFQMSLSLALALRLLSPSSAAPPSLTEAEDLLSRKDFPRAEEALKPLAEGGGEAEDYARFLLGEALSLITAEMLMEEGRTYGGGLHMLEPKELGNVDARRLVDILPELRSQSRGIQPSLF